MMPNHVHGIVVLQATHEGRGLAHVVQQFKAFSTKAINRAQQTRGPFWQRNYYEHIIRDDGDLERIRQYIAENPLRWSEDAEYIS
jgi:REP element-mobilizing transposase RayT